MLEALLTRFLGEDVLERMMFVGLTIKDHCMF